MVRELKRMCIGAMDHRVYSSCWDSWDSRLWLKGPVGQLKANAHPQYSPPTPLQHSVLFKIKIKVLENIG